MHGCPESRGRPADGVGGRGGCGWLAGWVRMCRHQGGVAMQQPATRLAPCTLLRSVRAGSSSLPPPRQPLTMISVSRETSSLVRLSKSRPADLISVSNACSRAAGWRVQGCISMMLDRGTKQRVRVLSRHEIAGAAAPRCAGSAGGPAAGTGWRRWLRPSSTPGRWVRRGFR